MHFQVTNYPVNLLEFLGVPVVNLSAQEDAIDFVLNMIDNNQYNKIVVYCYKYGLDPDEIASWLGVINPRQQMNEFRDMIRQNCRLYQILSEDFYGHDSMDEYGYEIESSNGSVEEEVIKLRMIAELKNAIDQALSEQEKRVIEAIYYDESPMEQVKKKQNNCEILHDEALSKLLSWLTAKGFND